MKKFSKILSVALLVALVLSLGVANAFAAPGDTAGGEGGEPETPAATTKTITLTGGKAGHTYNLYQIFTGKVATVDGVEQLTDIQWGADAPADYKDDYDTAAAAAKAVATQNDARAFAQSLNLADSGIKTVTLTADDTVVFDGLVEGYYIITDSNNNQAAVEGDYSSAVIVEVVNDVNGAMKGSGTTSDKFVQDVNDTTGESAGWEKSADYDIGDAVPFKLTANTASNVAMFRKYHVTFQDKQSDGLTAPTSWKVTVLGKEFTVPATGEDPATQTTTNGTKITVAKVAPDDGQTFAIKVTFEPTIPDDATGVTYLNAECNSQLITVEYTSVLNENAKIGSAEGNPNTSYIKYSNNPESTDDSDEGKTPPKTVIVFTYKVDVDKIDETGAPLQKAGFTLYKKYNAAVTGRDDNVAGTTPAGAKNDTFPSDQFWYPVKTIAAGEGTNFSFDGIDDGTYVLVESTTPDGYNTMAPITITVTAVHGPDSESVTGFSITTFTTGNDNFKADAKGGEVKFTKKNNSEKTLGSGEIYSEIVNNSGTQLPSTGGIGTTIFYVVGGVLVLAAIILLVTKKRMSE